MLQIQLKRYKFVIEYCGENFFGWQRQPGLPTVQSVVEDAAQDLCGTPVTFVCAGRTDTGVHAVGQVAHADIPLIFKDPLKALFFGLNQRLARRGVVIVDVEEVEEHFHARFSARKRTYMYRVLDRHCPTALHAQRVWCVRTLLDDDSMACAAACLKGTHDFKSFQSQGCSAQTTIRTMYDVRVERCVFSHEVRLFFGATAFLYHQVRNMVGALVFVGGGRMSVEGFRTLFHSLDPRKRVRMAPAHGLYLISVDYSAEQQA